MCYNKENEIREVIKMYQVVVCMENRHEYVDFFSQWAASVKAHDYAKCVDVERVYIINKETGEVLAEFV